MSQKIKLPTLTFIYKDPFQLETLYSFLDEWVMENNYRDKDNGDKLIEVNYEEQRQENVNHYRIWWRTFKIPNGSKFIRYHLNIDFLGLAFKKVEIIHEGKKIKADHGELTLWVDFFVNVDWNDFFSQHPLLKHFESWYKTRWMKKELEGHKAEIKRDQIKLQGSIKQYFEMWHYLPSDQAYHKKHEPT